MQCILIFVYIFKANANECHNDTLFKDLKEAIFAF